jgi:hypothetical protein
MTCASTLASPPICVPPVGSAGLPPGVLNLQLLKPLHLVELHAELMREGFYEPQGSLDALTRIQFSGKHLLGLINTVLDIANCITALPVWPSGSRGGHVWLSVVVPPRSLLTR